MPDNKPTNDPKATPQPSPDPTPIPTPSFVPSDEFKQFQSTINDRFNQFQDNFNAILASLNRQPTPTTPFTPADDPDVSPEELEQVLQEGKGADKLLKAMDLRVKRMKKEFDERVNQLESTGLTAISDLSKDAARTDMPYYGTYQKEIDSYVATLPAHLRTNKQVYVVAHNAIVGQHLPDILKAEREKILREAADPNTANLPTDINGRGQKSESETPTVEKLLGKEAADALTSIGRSPDQQAQRMGYKDWPTYAKFIKDQEESNA